ncbi:hypothetical protein OG562_31760 [Streptomyces sp. NBC_01275]|uniref:hypothetical protein n=1 Tax=Streptomyces sp. NBC_01275 TaxID=2903807 RepID=UPI00225AD005|nr:hypothetical protein [Streptomyces sp. NBC_01275]MCX4765471.1 hypothetical protein [Streptomyces sp. NBC_01275]
MAGRPQPRRITLGGREAVALTVAEYERLIASRRQIGGQSARVRVLAHQAKRTEQLLQDLERLVGSPTDCRAQDSQSQSQSEPQSDSDAGNDADCLRRALAELLRRHRDLAS